MPPGLKSHPQRRTVILSTSKWFLWASQDPMSQIVQLCTEGGTLSITKHLHVSTFCFLKPCDNECPCAPSLCPSACLAPGQTEKLALGNSTRSSCLSQQSWEVDVMKLIFFFLGRELWDSGMWGNVVDCISKGGHNFSQLTCSSPWGLTVPHRRGGTQFLTLSLDWS